MYKKILLTTLALFSISLYADTKQPNPANEIAKHYAALPNQYNFDGISKEKINDKITRQYIMGSESMIVKWTLTKDAVIPLHFHPNEQITWITQGSVRVLSQGKEFIVKAGGVLIIPPNVPHEFHALEDTIDIDYFTPARQDWLMNADSYLQNVQK